MRFELLRQQLQSPATVVRLNNGSLVCQSMHLAETLLVVACIWGKPCLVVAFHICEVICMKIQMT
jgi:hypothetical protein